MILVLGHVVARPESLDQVLETGRAHVERSRDEPGCVSHDMAVDADDPLKVRFIEQWADMDSLSAHFALAATRAFGAEMAALCNDGPSLSIYDASLLRRL
jgi:quinol monooxygenase YgiN